ncbi:cell envelope integrity protein CreD [Pelagimonas varians]|uniref:Inner membrane protein CreD n=1 Tax=Pelagimonas varians TaxID=696760 RepID=A0A238KLK7_9RHOB|nr:cell envelope integrity protein CreD [Pelagimonas varians]PYG29127.1 inner membrane protein [Pelagimonas varians]SMX43643.1 Inner membrane protein CreD [Pelagimonas varians]
MLKSPGRRFIVVGILVLLMFIPLFFAGEVINSRKHYSQDTIRNVGMEWGGQQTLSGPFLVIPVEREVRTITARPKVDPVTGLVMTHPETGEDLKERFEETVIKASDPVYLLPKGFDAQLSTQTQMRARGIFQVPVYQASVEMGFDFDLSGAQTQLADNETLLWDDARIEVEVSNNKALRGKAEIVADGAALPLAPMSGRHGFTARTGDPRGHQAYALALGLNGAQSLMVTPVGLDSHVTMTGDWPHPSFSGAFLPDGHEVTETGFSANWSIPHLARPLPQAGREPMADAARTVSGFGVRYIEPNDFYQKAYRAANYGILFIALTFLTILLIERGSGRPVHAVQYILVGLTQSVFVLLMVAYAEQIGFAAAYAVSAGATIALLTGFGAVAMKLGRRALVLGAVLVVVYAVLYLILDSADYALLAGSTLAFFAIALTMFATRNEDWFGPEQEKGPGILARMAGAASRPAPPAKSPETRQNPAP